MTGAVFDAEFIVVGSGPAGVSAAIPLVEGGRNVLMVDGSSGPPEFPKAKPTHAWTRFLGPDLEGLIPEDGLSPRLRMPALKTAAATYLRMSGIDAINFYPVS